MRKGGGGGRRAILKDMCRDMCARACDTERWIETLTEGMRVCESEERARARTRARARASESGRIGRRGREGYQPIIIIACIISSMPAASPPIPPCHKVSVFVLLYWKLK
jgi:hypothetical protein